MNDIYVVLSEHFERSVSVFSTLEKAKEYLETQQKKYGKHTVIKTKLDGKPVKLNDYFQFMSIDKL